MIIWLSKVKEAADGIIIEGLRAPLSASHPALLGKAEFSECIKV